MDLPSTASSGLPLSQNYGGQCRRLFFTDPEVSSLNHGSFGTIPIAVQQSCEQLTREIEKNPDRFIRMELMNRQVDSRKASAKLIGTSDVDTCVFIPNVSTAMNTVLKSFKWAADDYIVCNAVFPSIMLAIQAVYPPPQVSVFDLGGLGTHKNISDSFLGHIRSLKASIRDHTGAIIPITKTGARKIVAVFESITATPAILLPWKNMVEICRSEDVWSVVDAAHSLGQESDLNVEQADPDFWMTDFAKWYYAMRGCALLYVPLRNQEMICPLVPGVRYPTRGATPTKFVHSFYWSGMTDPVASLSIDFAIAFRNSLGGDVKLNAYCHDLAVQGGKLLARALGTRLLDESEGSELTASMANVQLPISSMVRESPAVYFQFDDIMFANHQVYAPPFYYRERWWVRVSAQIYNDLSDFERLAVALLKTCKVINQALAGFD